MILSVPELELRLQKQLFPFYETRIDHGCDSFANTRFVVMLSLVCGIDPAKPVPECRFGQLCRSILLSGRAVEKPRDSDIVNQCMHVDHFRKIFSARTVAGPLGAQHSDGTRFSNSSG